MTQNSPYQVLDPCFLGRPVHLLHRFAAQLQDDLRQALLLPGHRRYWGAFQVEQVGFERIDESAAARRWSAFGEVTWSIERALLLAVLEHRYGQGAAAEARVTATEERLADALGLQLAHMLVRRIDLNGGKLPPALAPAGQARQPAQPLRGAWVACVRMRNPDSGVSGQFWLVLGTELMIALLRGLQPPRVAAARPAAPAPLAAALKVKLDARLASKEMPLGALFDLQVGTVVPISLDRAEVLLDESRLFTALVNEHKGKLCLTAFEDAA